MRAQSEASPLFPAALTAHDLRVLAPTLEGGPPAFSASWPTISIVLTIYPADPGGSITVQNYIAINVRSADFRKLDDTMGQLLAELRKSNEIAGEVRDKLVAEMQAGMTTIKSPKPDRRAIEIWLLRPLKYIFDKRQGQ
jgi:hypothetical protein